MAADGSPGTLARRVSSSAGSAALVEALAEFVALDRVRNNIERIFSSDRLSTFSAYEATSRFVFDAMKSAGLAEVELEPLPADGKTRFGDWIMPLAWDVDNATLRLTGKSGTQLLADYKQLPDSLIMQSAPTPEGGVECELVSYERSTRADWKDKVIFTHRHAQHIKAELAAAGALGVISDHHPFPQEDPNSTYWYNTWSDQPGGWLASAHDSKLFGFSLPPAVGAEIEKQLARGDILRVRCVVNSRFRSGTYPFISGLIPADSASPTAQEELLVCGHLYEHGAHDNASGASCVLETAAMLSAAIAAGVMARPARNIRFLLMPECYGTLAYATLRAERIKRTVAGVNLDGAGSGLPVRIVREPDSCDAGLAEHMHRVASCCWKAEQLVYAPFELCDNLLSDPAIGVPMVWPHAPCIRKTWHTSLDTLDVTSVEAVCKLARVAGVFLSELSERKEIRAQSPGVVRQTAASAEFAAVPVRLGIGPVSLDPVPVSEWPGYLKMSPRWCQWMTRALWFADGKRSLKDIAVLAGQEKNLEELRDYFRFLERHGYLRLTQP